jgi:hypothetical protein
MDPARIARADESRSLICIGGLLTACPPNLESIFFLKGRRVRRILDSITTSFFQGDGHE